MEIIVIILGACVLFMLYTIDMRLKEIDRSINDFNGEWLKKNNPYKLDSKE